MAVSLEFINVIIPIENIKKCLGSEGFEELLKEEEKWLGKTIWYDEQLYREGAMNMLDIEMIIKRWENSGLNLFKIADGVKMWDQLCVVDSANGLTLPCDWVELDLKELKAHYKRSI